MRHTSWIAAGLCLVLVGCVPYQTHEQTKRELEKAKEANADLVKKYNRAVQEIAALQKEIEGKGDSKALLAKLQALEAERDRLSKQLDARPRFDPSDVKDIPGATVDSKGNLVIGSALLFDSGKAALKTDSLRTLDQILALLKSKYPGERLILEGHTDDERLNSTALMWKTNMNLGYNRAYAVFEYFSEHGILESQMKIHACSYNEPVDDATKSTEQGRRQNRRVVVRRAGAEF